MKYPGAKTVMIPDIKKVFERSGLRKFVDVFGGSGVVSLNVRAEHTVYNDIDGEIVNLFRMIQKEPGWLYGRLEESVRAGRFHRDPEMKRSSNRVFPIITGRAGSSVSSNGSMSARKEENEIRRNEERAFFTLFRFSTGFGGMGKTYSTSEKSTYRYALKTMEQFEYITRKVRKWIIENADFRELFAKYDPEDVFFYVDPPYYNKNWYNHNFVDQDYIDLRDILRNLKGKFLMNLNAEDQELAHIFGHPNFTRAYENQNAIAGTKPPRIKSFYTNV